MKNIIVPLNAFPKNEVIKQGQAHFIPAIASAGAYGVEIRRELFTEKDLPLEEIYQEASKHQLFIVYSAPVEVWREDGSLNRDELQQIFVEARRVGAGWIKTSLGAFNPKRSNVCELHELLQSLGLLGTSPQLLVENDQTPHGGSIKRFRSFFECVHENHVQVRMTFDIGNWMYTGEDVMEAYTALSVDVLYLHLKHVVKMGEQFVTLPLPFDVKAAWSKVMLKFPSQMVKALEFPIQPQEKVKEYIQSVTDMAALRK